LAVVPVIGPGADRHGREPLFGRPGTVPRLRSDRNGRRPSSVCRSSDGCRLTVGRQTPGLAVSAGGAVTAWPPSVVSVDLLRWLAPTDRRSGRAPVCDTVWARRRLGRRRARSPHRACGRHRANYGPGGVPLAAQPVPISAAKSTTALSRHLGRRGEGAVKHSRMAGVSSRA